MMDQINSIIQSSIAVKQQVLSSPYYAETIESIVLAIVQALQADKKILFCGNGGSAADAQHLAAEFSGRFYSDRPALYAEALHCNTSYITAVGNDYSYDVIYSRMIEGIGREGDVLVGISTSGNSKNIVNALNVSKSKKMICIGMTGDTGGEMKNCVDHLLNIPSNDTPRIQECHILLGHIICQLVEEKMFNK
jgi:D-sedoheptulose 7-phosphate isomerase